ncbi:hypothetical protein [Amaricoccus sp.]|uniref:hypothetical protein n=1 Tax=Amaricoccus sp. TaxID=1872485 RepID=UPI0025BBD3B3|nr:hypothetical protein [Amaricoccus sp.]
MRRDKGLGGPALGPHAPGALCAAFRTRGYTVRCADSPWRLPPGALVSALVEGIAGAAAEAGFVDAPAWGQARTATASAAVSVFVGHVDVLALPPASAQSKTTSVSSP